MESYDSSETETHNPGDQDGIDYDINREPLYMDRKHTNDEGHAGTLSHDKHPTVIPENDVGVVVMFGTPIISLYVEGKERLCLAQISNTLLRQFSYNEIHNRRVALGITCMQCTPIQLEILRRLGAMPVSSRRCGLITRREAERLVKSFLEDNAPPTLPDNFYFKVYHKCGWGSQGHFIPTRYNSSRAKCIKCVYCSVFFSPNKFIFHFHRLPNIAYRHADAANFNSWRKHLHLAEPLPSEDIIHAWEDVKAMFNGGSRKRLIGGPPLDTKTKSKELSFVPYSQKENSVDVDVPITLNERFHAAPSYPINPIYNTAASSLLTRTHPAFPKPRVPTSYGDFFRSLSAPYSMWWMKYAPITAGYNMNQIPRPPLDIPGVVTQPWSANFKNVSDPNISPDSNNKMPLKYNPCDYGDQWNWFGLMPNSLTSQQASSSSMDRAEIEANICEMKKNYDEKADISSDVCKHHYSHRSRPTLEDREVLSMHTDVASSEDRTHFDLKEPTVSQAKYPKREQNIADIQSKLLAEQDLPSFSTMDEYDQHSINRRDTRKDKLSFQQSNLFVEEHSLSDGELDNIIPEDMMLEQVSIENLRKLLSRARKLRKKAEKGKKRLQESLEEQDHRRDELREKMAKQSEDIKAELTSVISEERNTKLVMERKLKESRNALNALCGKMILTQRCSEVPATDNSPSTAGVNLA